MGHIINREMVTKLQLTQINHKRFIFIISLVVIHFIILHKRPFQIPCSHDVVLALV